MIYGDGFAIMSFLCDHGSKQRDEDMHGGKWTGMGRDGGIQMISLHFIYTPVRTSQIQDDAEQENDVYDYAFIIV